MKNIIVDVDTDETKLALLDNGKLIELIVDKKENSSLVGNIYVARVMKILPSQFAFVDIGNKKNVFIHLTDSKEKGLYYNKNGKPTLKIKQNDEILVQITKDSSGEKGFCATTQLSFTGQFVVILNDDANELGISQKIDDENIRQHLKTTISPLVPSGFSVILRTKARNCTLEIIQDEINKLTGICNNIIELGKYVKAPKAIYTEASPLNKAVSAFYTADIDAIYINDCDKANEINEYLSEQNPDGLKKLHLYDLDEPIFQHFNIEAQLKKAFHKKVWLKSGGFIIIEQTEAAVVIDVNTGKFIGNKNHENTVLKTNLEAAEEIAYQIRLRNLSGMIIIDFIDLRNSEDIKILNDYLKAEFKKDRVNVNIVGATQLGLYLLTRKKTREPLQNFFYTTCKHCNGLGKIYKF